VARQLTARGPGKPQGQQYGYGITQLRFGPNAVYFHGDEMPGYNSFMGYDPTNRVTLTFKLWNWRTPWRFVSLCWVTDTL
jgi:hypothetical protein